MNLKTFSLLRAVGPPIVENRGQKGSDFSKELYRLAYHNKIPLTYLKVLSSDAKAETPYYNYHKARFQRKLKVIERISELFKRENITYAIFKTLKPFEEYGADIDILNLGLKLEYGRMVKTLAEESYCLLLQLFVTYPRNQSYLAFRLPLQKQIFRNTEWE